MKLQKLFILILVLSFAFHSCELTEPVDDNHSTLDRVYEDPSYAEGLLMKAYRSIPTTSWSFNDVATDDAVSNDLFNSYKRAATGEWSARYNPFDQWEDCNEGIVYLNHFMENVVDSVEWKWTNSELNRLYTKRFKGEAYALRALLQYHVLVTVGGVGENGELLGIPVYDEVLSPDDDFNEPRATFAESVEQIYSDIDNALEYLTMDHYRDIGSASNLPDGYEDVEDVSHYNAVFGDRTQQRINGQFIKALKARLALLAASPAFNDGDVSLWEDAANYAADVINDIGGVDGMDTEGHRFYQGDQVDAIDIHGGDRQEEIILRTSIDNSNSMEENNFPPSLYGDGDVNPTQNLVEAFPTADGYPIDHPSSDYNPENPYANRDPRLSLYIIHNGSEFRGEEIQTGVGGGYNAKDSISTSTETGYYMKKLLREDVNANPDNQTSRKHYNVHMRFTELFLIYAEAANEAWGPDGTGANSYSARDVISNIRERAGIDQPDEYLASIADKEDMRNLIRNERRLELCFEGFRFWDLRRWESDLTVPARGVEIDGSGNYEYIDIEERDYNNDYMHYGPIPESEDLRSNALIQNRGW